MILGSAENSSTLFIRDYLVQLLDKYAKCILAEIPSSLIELERRDAALSARVNYMLPHLVVRAILSRDDPQPLCNPSHPHVDRLQEPWIIRLKQSMDVINAHQVSQIKGGDLWTYLSDSLQFAVVIRQPASPESSKAIKSQILFVKH